MRVDLGPIHLTTTHLAAAAVVAVTSLVMIAVLLRSDSVDGDGSEPYEPGFDWAKPERLVLPDTAEQFRALRFVPYRPRREIWTAGDIAEYWLDPRTIGLEVLDTRVEEHIRRLLEEVP